VNEGMGQNLHWIEGIPHCKVGPLSAGLHAIHISSDTEHPSFQLNVFLCVFACPLYYHLNPKLYLLPPDISH